MSNELLARFYCPSGRRYDAMSDALEGFTVEPDWSAIRCLPRNEQYGLWLGGIAYYRAQAVVVLYRKDIPHEVLVIPFRAEEWLAGTNRWEPPEFRREVQRQVSALLSIVRGKAAQNWRAQLGYESLLESIAGQDVQALGWFVPEGFSAVRLPQSIEDYIGIDADTRPSSAGTADILPMQVTWRRRLEEASESLQPFRDTLLDSIDIGGSVYENAQRELSAHAYEAAKALAQMIHDGGFPPPPLPAWLDQYRYPHLFDLAHVHRKQLKSMHTVSPQLRTQFEDKDELLAVGATIDATENESEWVITSNGTKYLVRFEDRTYKVYGDMFDNETLNMLETAVTIGQFVPEHEKYAFDYSVAACGLWKAVERELNLSLIWHLRRLYGIVGPRTKFRYIPPKSKVPRVCGQKIDKLDKEDGTQLEGLMLGPIESILDTDSTNSGLGIAFQPSDQTGQALGILQSPQTIEKLEEVHKIRNRFAHISSMRQDKYVELKELILPENGFSLLEEVLKAKQLIDRYWQMKDHANGFGLKL